jgi:hypothetical protein
VHAGEIGLGEEANQGSVDDATTAATTGLWGTLSSDAVSGDGVYLALCDVEDTSGLFFLVPKILADAEWSTLTFPVAKRHAASFSSMEAIPLTVLQGDSIKEQDRPQMMPKSFPNVSLTSLIKPNPPVDAKKLFSSKCCWAYNTVG